MKQMRASRSCATRWLSCMGLQIALRTGAVESVSCSLEQRLVLGPDRTQRQSRPSLVFHELTYWLG